MFNGSHIFCFYEFYVTALQNKENLQIHFTTDCIQAGLNTLVGWGLKMFMKVLGLVSYMEKMISDPSEPTFVIRVCQICTIPKL